MKIHLQSSAVASILVHFENYLREHGCEMLPKTNEYELVRFKSALGVGVIYTGKGGLSCNAPFVSEALDLHLEGKPWPAGKIAPVKRRTSPKRKAELLLRDGDNCFYCNKPLGEDITEEHLVSVSQQGYNRLDNIVLAHKTCNNLASHKSLVEKILLRDELRNSND